MCLRAYECERVKCRLITPLLRFHCSRISGTLRRRNEAVNGSLSSPLHSTFIPPSLQPGNAVWSLADVVVKPTHRSQEGGEGREM